MSRVDVIVPCYNYGRFLRQCVESVLTQEGVDVRVLVIDDCSTDDSEVVGRQLAAEDGRVEYRRHAVNKGHIATYNEGLAWASGTYCVLLSADDLLAPGSFARATRLMNCHPEVGFTYGHPIKFFTPDPPPWPGGKSHSYGWKILSGTDLLAKSCPQGHTDIQAPTVVVRSDLQKRVGGYRADLPHSGDTEMWLRLAAHASVGVLDVVQAYYRQHCANMFREYSGIRAVLQQQAAFETHFREYADRIPQLAHHERALNRAVAREMFWAACHAFQNGDLGGCKHFLGMAKRTSPEIARSTAWARLWCKRLIGRRLWATLHPMARGVRRVGRHLPLRRLNSVPALQ